MWRMQNSVSLFVFGLEIILKKFLTPVRSLFSEFLIFLSEIINLICIDCRTKKGALEGKEIS